MNFHSRVEIWTKCHLTNKYNTPSHMQITLNNYEKLLSQIQKIISQTERNIIQTVNREKILMSWQVGKIIDEHLTENSRADYGKKLFEQIEKDTKIAQSILYQMRKFYKAYPTLPKNENDLSWSHYRNLASVQNKEKQKYLEDLTVKNNLSVNELQRAILKSKKAEKKTVQKSAPKKLKVTRGQIFSYEIVALADSKKTFVDLGFNMFFELKTSLKIGEIVESKKSAEKFSLKKSNVKPAQMHTYKAYLERVVDGDTVHVVLDLGFKMQHREILRLAKINAPEAKTSEGRRSSDSLKKILKDVPFLIVKTNKTDIYGRYVADVFFDETGKETDPQKIADSGTYLSQLLLDRGLVEEY